MTDITDRHLPPDLRIMLVAFEGWNDAGGAASGALDMLAEQWHASVYAELDPEEYHDFQVNRPQILSQNGSRVLVWPGTSIFRANEKLAHSRQIYLVRGIEPSLRWQSFVSEIIEHATDLEIDLLVTVGALLIDTPHTRPLPIFATSEDPQLRELLGIEAADYAGPTGIVGVLSHLATAHLPVLSLWVGVPGYLGGGPNPKAQTSLLVELERLLQESIDYGTLPTEVDLWQQSANEYLATDEEIAAHVTELESIVDELSLPHATGEAIAAEFERFLRKSPKSPPEDESPTSGAE